MLQHNGQTRQVEPQRQGNAQGVPATLLTGRITRVLDQNAVSQCERLIRNSVIKNQPELAH